MSSQRQAVSAQPQAPAETIFRTDRTHLLGALVMAMISLLVIGVAPLKLGWLLLFPIVFAYWVLKSTTTVNENGITAHYAFRGSDSLTWEQFAGVRFGGSKAYARDIQGKEFVLPGISFNSLPDLSEASRGRITDALTAGQEAASEKVVVIHSDGRQVIKTKEEVAAEAAKATQGVEKHNS